MVLFALLLNLREKTNSIASWKQVLLIINSLMIDLTGGLISDHKGCNIPSGNISLDVITPKDAIDLKLIAELNPEFVLF